MISDSTMANKPLEGNPERGGGQMFHEFFNENGKFHDTHFSEFGARLIACLAAQHIKERKLGLSKFIIGELDKCY